MSAFGYAFAIEGKVPKIPPNVKQKFLGKREPISITL
jgi:hypothetical protein